MNESIRLRRPFPTLSLSNNRLKYTNMSTPNHADHRKSASYSSSENSSRAISPDTPTKLIRLTSQRSFRVPGDDIGSSTTVDSASHRDDCMDGDLFSFSSSRRRFSRTTMDAAGAMHRLRISMVGHAGDSTVEDYGHRGDGEASVPLAPDLSSILHSNNDNVTPSGRQSTSNCSPTNGLTENSVIRVLGQVPAIALIGIFHLMIGVPFGVSYFPMQWVSSATGGSDAPDSSNYEFPEGEFPIPGKEAFGIRLFLFSTMIGQIVFTFFSGFPNPIGLQMVENIGFTRELAIVAISHQGYGIDALATLMVMFGLSSILVGVVFYFLGRFRLGKIVYFFPTHVLIGLIGGIGVLLCRTGLEVTIADAISFSSLINSWALWIVIVGLEILLRILEWLTSDSKGRPKFALLSPVFFCMITPLFYLALWAFQLPVSKAEDAGYFFPSMVQEGDVGSSGGFGTPWDIWKVRSSNRTATRNDEIYPCDPLILHSSGNRFFKSFLGCNHRFFADDVGFDSFQPDSCGTLVRHDAMHAFRKSSPHDYFSSINQPINIPAFSLSTEVDVDMNQELVAHGFSNMLAGFCGGLQNYMAYTQSVL